MKNKVLIGGVLLAAFAALVFLLGSGARAGDSYKSAASTPTATEYLIESSHTTESCLKALDEVKNLGSDKLDHWSWGCMYGNHTGYLIVKAKSEAEALNNVPAADRDKAKVYPLGKFTAEQITAIHKQKGM